MPLEVPISPRADAWLAEQARTSGKDKAAIVADIVEHAVVTAEQAPTLDAEQIEERVRRFLAWAATIPARPGPPVNTHRSSIYERET